MMSDFVKRKNFLFDLTASQPNESGAYHGGGKYAKKVFLEFVNHYDAEKWDVLALYDSTKHLDEELKEIATRKKITLIDIDKSNLKLKVKEFDIKRIYSALPIGAMIYGLNDLLGSECEIYGTIHGLRTLEINVPLDAIQYETDLKQKMAMLARKVLEKRLYKRDWSRYNSLLKNTNVLAVSNHTKHSILAHFPEIHESLKVFYSPDVTEFENMSDDKAALDFKMSDYFLLISGNRWLKNNMRSVVALDQLFSERPDIKQNVVIVGVNNPGIFLKKIKNKNRFFFHGYVSENFLKTLYNNAFAFLYMTLNEGFGYPPLEAMKIGVPVITTPHTSIFEICGESVLYSNPYSIAEIKNRILQLRDTEIYNRLSESGKERYAVVRKRQDDDLRKMVQYLSE